MSSKDPYQYPKLRWPLDVQFREVEGKRILILSCPLGFTDQPLGLHAAVAPLLEQFQGKLSLAEIEQKFSAQGCSLDLLNQLVALLDTSLFLESPTFIKAATKTKSDFLSTSERPAFLAGLSYSADSGSLTRELDGFLKNNIPPEVATQGRPMLGIMSPHIDYRRGGTCYGITWNQIRNHEHDLYLVMGTSHQYSDLMFHLTRKDFASPLGILPCDRDFINGVAQRYGPVRSFADELLHRREHSLELQIPFLKHLAKSPRIAPILVGSFHHMLRSGKSPQEFDIYEEFIGSLTENVQRYLRQGSRICIVAGVDMAHVGKQFGDTEPLSPEFMAEVAQRDHAYLDTLLSQNKSALWAHIEEDLDRRRICGFPTMYTILDLFDRLNLRYHAQLFDYRQAVDYETQCAVTFAGMGLYL